MFSDKSCTTTEQTNRSETCKRDTKVSDRRDNRLRNGMASNTQEQPLIACLIGGESFNVYIEETFSINKDNKSGVLLRLPKNNTKFFCPFERITFKT